MIHFNNVYCSRTCTNIRHWERKVPFNFGINIVMSYAVIIRNTIEGNKTLQYIIDVVIKIVSGLYP